MFEISFILAIKHLLLYFFLPIIPGILFIWIFFGYKFKGMMLYILSWFLGLGVVTFFIYNLQIFKFGISKLEYFILLFLLIVILIIKLNVSKTSIGKYFHTLVLKCHFMEVKESFVKLGIFERVSTVFISLYIILFLILGLAYSISFPTYFDDSFGNWALGSVNMYFDGGYKVFGDQSEILGKGGRVNYPIYISIFKALVADFSGFWYEIYQNLFQYISFLLLVIFSFLISFKKSKNLFLSVLPGLFLTGISLVFFHVIDGYMDLSSGIYSVFVVYFFYKFIKDYRYEYLILGILFGILLINIKNDGLVVYFPGIVFGLLTYLFIKKDLLKVFKGFFVKENISKLSFILFFFFLPPFFVRFYHGLALNPQANDGFENTSWIHPEIFNYFDEIFLLENNYNLVLLFIPLIFLNFSRGRNSFIILSCTYIFVIFMLVFLLTSNYRWVLDQTTVNRAFMSCFVVLFSFFTIIYSEKKK